MYSAHQNRFNWRQFVIKNKLQLGLGLIGLFLMAWGVFKAISQIKSDAQVEIITSDNNQDAGENELVVDVNGAVEKPGVYRLGSDARINDALIAAGGLSADADRTWVARFVNLASKLQDGMKIYIPSQGTGEIESQEYGVANQSTSIIAGSTTDEGLITSSNSEAVNINTATASELDALWGIGEKRAQDIIDNRPYSNIEELKTKANIPQNVIDQNQDKLTVY